MLRANDQASKAPSMKLQLLQGYKQLSVRRRRHHAMCTWRTWAGSYRKWSQLNPGQGVPVCKSGLSDSTAMQLRA